MNFRRPVAVIGLMASVAVGIATREDYINVARLPTKNDVPTVGFGSTKGVKLGDTTTPVRALQRLVSELESEYVTGIKKCIKVPLYDYEFGAFVSLSYNIGVPAFCGSTLVKKLNAGDYPGACDEILRWDKQKGKVLAGLTKRRAEERAVCGGKNQ